MTALTKLAALRRQELQLLALKCADPLCKHTLGRHSVLTDQCGGEIGGKVCRCRGWRDPKEQLVLK